MADRPAPRLAVTARRATADVAAPLLGYLRRELGAPSIEYAEPPTPILGGFDTSIYGFRLSHVSAPHSEPLIVRVFRGEGDAERALFEAAVQNGVASLGYPAPRVLLAEVRADALGAPFTIMQRMPGRAMLDALIGPRMGSMPALLGRAQARLHDLDTQEFRRLLGGARDPRRLDTLDDLFRRYEEGINAASLDGLRPALRWLDEHRPPSARRDSVCHGDFHPLNVLVVGNDVSGVVDWGWVAVADPAYDVGASVALFTQGPVDLPRIVRPVGRVVRRWMLRRYLRAYAAERPLDLDAVRYFEAYRLLAFLCEAGEQIQAVAGVVQSDMQSPFFDPPVRESIMKRLREITGVEVALPRG